MRKRREPHSLCPLLNKPCVGIECAWYTQLQGKHPQTGDDINEWGCSMTWLPLLMIENSQQQRQTGAAVESFRNEMVQANQTSQELLATTMQHALPQGRR